MTEAAEIAHSAIFLNHGQNCCAGSRTFVQENIYDEFVKRATELAAKRRVGDPFEKGVQQGPQVDDEMFNKVLGYIESGKNDGAKLETGGKRVGTKGYFIEPTVFSNVTDDMKIAREEVSLSNVNILTYKFTSKLYLRFSDQCNRYLNSKQWMRSSRELIAPIMV